jgi:transketolase C-terminal domain/subunit
VTIEEHSFRGGFSGAILESAAKNGIRADIRVIASLQNNLSQIGDQTFLRSENGLTVQKIIDQFSS